VWSHTPEHVRRFAEEHGVRAAPNAEAAVRDADVVVTATDAREPIVRGAWLKPGAHVNAVGSPRPNWRELDDETMKKGVLFVDSRDAVLHEAGDVILSKAPIYAEVGEIFAGTKPKPPAGSTTVFKSVGIAVEDIAAARLVYEADRARGAAAAITASS
jgi:thiomorpholine-carboxylate dehydrogenase